MTQIGMRELKENMGRFVLLIKKGEKITLHYRGKPLALVSSLHNTSHSSLKKEEKLLAALEERGLITGGKGQLKLLAKPLKVRGKTISDLVIDSRE